MFKIQDYIYITLFFCLFLVDYNACAAVINVPNEEFTIQSGIDAAENGDTVLVAKGVYKGPGNVNIDFKGKQIIVKSESGPKTTIITCSYQSNTRGFSFTNKETNDAVLEGFTIRNGIHINGGGIYIFNSSPTIKNCIVEWNRAVKESTVTGRGGGIYAKNSEVEILGCTIINNQAEYTYGGGVCFEGDKEDPDFFLVRFYQPGISNSIIDQNTGSGIHNIGYVQTHIKKSIISRNTRRGIVATDFQRGGTYITNCVISQNTGGGVECNQHSIMEIKDSVIKQNTGEFGGGIYGNTAASIEATNCVIAQNIAQRTGGGIVTASKFGGTTITNCTITRNVSEEQGGGVYAFSFGAGFTMLNSIVWANSSNGTHNNLFGSGPSIVIKKSDIKDGIQGIEIPPFDEWLIYEDNIDSDPLFVDPDNGDYRLIQGSPAVGMGANTLSQIPTSVRSVGKKWLRWGELKLKTR